MSHSGHYCSIGVRHPASSILFQFQATFRGVRIGSTTENGSCQSVPDSGTARDGGEGECLLGRGYEDLSLVVCSDQDA